MLRQGIQSSSPFETIQNIIKSKIKSIYLIIPHKNYLKFVSEEEYIYKIRNKTSYGKIKDLFDNYHLVEDVSDVEFSNSGFINALDDDNSEYLED